MSFLGNHFGNVRQTLKLAVQHFCLLFKGFNNFFLNYDILYTKLTLIFLFLLLGFAGTVALCGAVEIPLALDTLGVGLGRKGVVGVVGVPGGVWLGVEGVDVALPGVTTDDWLSDRIDTGGIA